MFVNQFDRKLGQVCQTGWQEVRIGQVGQTGWREGRTGFSNSWQKARKGFSNRLAGSKDRFVKNFSRK